MIKLLKRLLFFTEPRPQCFCCGNKEDLKTCPIMTGDKFSEVPKYPVCGFCFRAWYDPDNKSTNSWEEVKIESLKLQVK